MVEKKETGIIKSIEKKVNAIGPNSQKAYRKAVLSYRHRVQSIQSFARNLAKFLNRKPSPNDPEK